MFAPPIAILPPKTPIDPPPLVWKLREAKRFGVKSGAGMYDYAEGKKTGVWSGLAALVPNRGTRAAGKDEILSISSWAADWATAKEEKFQKKAAKDDDEPPNPHGGMGAPGMPGMPMAEE